jgi:hypothetical protein
MTNTVNESIAEQQELPFVGVERDEDILWRVTIKRPGVNRECLWGEPMGKNTFRLTQAPALQPDIFMDDIVEALPMEDEPHPVFTRVVKPSGNRSVALVSDRGWRSQEMHPVLARIQKAGVDTTIFTDSVMVVTIPPNCDWTPAICSFLSKATNINAKVEGVPVDGDLIKRLNPKPCKCGYCGDPKDMVLYHHE